MEASIGGTPEVMQVVVDNRMAHFGAHNGNPLCMAAAPAVDEVATRQALAAAEQVNNKAAAMDTIIREYELPDHTVGFGAKGAVIWSPTPISNYRAPGIRRVVHRAMSTSDVNNGTRVNWVVLAADPVSSRCRWPYR